MDANTAMKFVSEYAQRIERIRYAEQLIKVQEIAIQRAQDHLKTLHEGLAKEIAHRDEAHDFALSAIRALTPERGFTV